MKYPTGRSITIILDYDSYEYICARRVISMKEEGQYLSMAEVLRRYLAIAINEEKKDTIKELLSQEASRTR